MNKSTTLQVVGTIAAIAVLAGAAFAASPTFAAKGGSHGGGQTGGATPTITLDQTDPHLGDSVTFTTNAGTVIELLCYQSGLGLAYFAEQPVGTPFLLGGTTSSWLTAGGPAECYAYLFNRLSDGPLNVAIVFAGGAR